MAIIIFGSYFKRKREKAGLTLKEVGKKLGYTTPQFPWNWENGKSLPPLNKMVKLAKILNVSEDELMEMHRLQKMSQLTSAYDNL